MTAYLVKRISASLTTAVIASFLIFWLIRQVPGDVVAQMMGQAGSQEAELSLRAFFGLDESIPRQYVHWLGNVLQGDLGTSWIRGVSVAAMVGKAFLVTVELAMLTLAVATIIGVPLGLFAGIHEGRFVDHVVQSLNVGGLAAPVFWVGLMLLVVVSNVFAWSPPLQFTPPSESVGDNLAIILLPMLSLAFLQTAAYSQFVRQNVISALHQDYVRTAIAKGMPTRLIFFKHILRNIAIPIVTFMGLILIQILGGVVIVESLFALPGLGRLLLASIQTRDYPVLQGALLVVVVVAMVVNLLVDIAYRFIDPRLRRS